MRRTAKKVLSNHACIAIYLLFFFANIFRILRHDNLASDGNTVLFEPCGLRPHRISGQKIDNTREKDKRFDDGNLFRILCTSTRKRMKWGSYQLRCRDLKAWAQKCTKNVQMVTNISFEDIQRLRWLRYIFGQVAEEEKIAYNTTIFVKSFPEKWEVLPLYGNMYVDMVDEYGYSDEDITTDVQLILQTEWQGSQIFPSHNYSVVEHWYNSFPADMALSGPPEYVPSVSQKSNITIATVWNTKRLAEPTEGGCPKLLSSINVSYECLDRPFDISTWYLKLFKDEKDKCEMEETLANPELGPGMLYYNVFRKFDALVVLAKNDTMKLNYGNVQRAISQMRSGTPVLIEIRGKVLEDFVERYNYTCTFQRYHNSSTTLRSDRHQNKYWSFNEAVEQLKRPEIRQKCQEQGLAIVKDYAPSRIAQKFLRRVGYTGDFLC